MNIKLKNIILKEAKSSACIKQFGQTLFGEFSKWYGQHVEDDTKTEKQIWYLLKDWINGRWDGDQKPPSLKKAFLQLQKCMSSYPEVLKPKTNILYRSTLKTNEEIKENVKKNNGKFLYSPHSEIQSWTTKEIEARRFITTVNDYNKIKVLLKAKFPKKELLFNANFLATLGLYELGEDEWEVIRISKKPILCEYDII